MSDKFEEFKLKRKCDPDDPWVAHNYADYLVAEIDQLRRQLRDQGRKYHRLLEIADANAERLKLALDEIDRARRIEDAVLKWKNKPDVANVAGLIATLVTSPRPEGRI